MIQIPVALQLYSLREMFPVNPLETLKTVKEMGFTGVEFYGDHFNNEFYAALLKESGLVCAGWHTPINALEADQFQKTVERNLAVGNKYVIVPYFKAETADGWKKFADRLNEAAAKLRPYGLYTGFHCHAHEFAPVDGIRPWEIVCANTEKEVILQLDTGNAMAGGADIYATLEAFPERNQSIHFKPYKAPGDFKVALGEDDHDLERLLAWCQEVGDTDWIIVEYEKEDPLNFCRKSLEAIRALQK